MNTPTETVACAPAEMPDERPASLLKRFVQTLVGWTPESLSRVVMNRTTLQWVSELPTHQMDAVEISGLAWKKLAKFSSYRSAWYPEFDICKGTCGPTDIIFAEQVFEHLPNPYQAVKNVYASLKPGGYFLVTVPFMYILHACPLDCTRWSPQGLGFLLESAGFQRDRIRIDSWGNRQAARLQLKPRNYCKRLHSLKNDPDFPLEAWALAQK